MRVLPVNASGSNRTTARPCLYLGPRGERCARPALAGGFCNEHDPEGARRAWVKPVKRGGAILVALSALWPLLVDLVRAIGRLLR